MKRYEGEHMEPEEGNGGKKEERRDLNDKAGRSNATDSDSSDGENRREPECSFLGQGRRKSKREKEGNLEATKLGHWETYF